MNRITVLGGGAWGTALAVTLVRAGREVTLWARDAETVEHLNGSAANPRYLPGIKLDPTPAATDDLPAALSGADCLLSVVPAQTTRALFSEFGNRLAKQIPVVLCAKGIERSTGKLMSELAAELLPQNPAAALSGPSFATDVAKGLPTAVTVAAHNAELAASLAAAFSSDHFRCYSSADLTGVEIGGALKNVLAIAAGAVSGAGLGASAEAAMVTRGFVELRRIGAAYGAKPETLMGLSGLGDLILSCGSAQSRNFAYGQALGRGEELAGQPLAEGVATAAIAAEIAASRGIEAPIVAAVDAVLKGRISIADAVAALLSRPLKSETD
ncbi:MAG: NAD(P)-dependent glycerol-3-phosphate dehydrogenase [Rhizobiaceae bacterium]|nr:NAD(P)-dependent glycerol-3-phosphate dehydrogenase [Rhizobiaceae bacterium]